MPLKKNMAVPEGNCSNPQHTSGLLGGIKVEELRRIVSEASDNHFDELEENLDTMSEITDRMLRATDQRLGYLEHDAR